MTIIAGVVCEDGVVLAADSASTDTETQTKQPFIKIKRLGQQKVLYGASGDVGLLQKVDTALEGFSVPQNIKRVRQELRARIVPELQEAAKYHVPYPAPGFNIPPPGVLLFALICSGRPWLLEIERDGRDTIYDEQLGNFAAIGSGKPWAQAIFRPFMFTPRNIELGKVFAYRVIDDAVELASFGLARPIRIWTLPIQGEPSQVSDDDMARLAEVRGIWREMETETVGRLLAPRPAPQPETQIPRPEVGGQGAPRPEPAAGG